MGSINSRRYRSIDFARAICCIWIVTTHFPPEAGILQSLGGFGQLVLPSAGRALSAFFVISGFCMACAASRARSDGATARTFLYHRLRRILPPYWLSFAVLLAIPYLS